MSAFDIICKKQFKIKTDGCLAGHQDRPRRSAQKSPDGKTKDLSVGAGFTDVSAKQRQYSIDNIYYLKMNLQHLKAE